MSRAHDGHRTFLPFGNPFRAILLRGSHLSPKLNVLLTTYEEALAASLRKLKPEDISSVLTLSWMRHAIDCLSEAHTNIRTLITELQFPISDWDEKWVDIYLNSSVKLLDICIALSSELSQLDQGQLLLRYGLHALDSSDVPSAEHLKRAQTSLEDWMKRVSTRCPRLDSCSVILQDLAGNLYLTKIKNSGKGRVLMRALYGTKTVTIFICSVLVAILSGCSKQLMELHVSDKFLWSQPFNDLQAGINGELRRRFSSGSATAVKELEAVEACVRRLHILTSAGHPEEKNVKEVNSISHEQDVIMTERSIDNEERQELLDCISNMAKSAEGLRLGLDSLSKRVGEFFQILLTGRDALLCNLRISDVSDAPEIKS